MHEEVRELQRRPHPFLSTHFSLNKITNLELPCNPSFMPPGIICYILESQGKGFSAAIAFHTFLDFEQKAPSLKRTNVDESCDITNTGYVPSTIRLHPYMLDVPNTPINN